MNVTWGLIALSPIALALLIVVGLGVAHVLKGGL